MQLPNLRSSRLPRQLHGDRTILCDGDRLCVSRDRNRGLHKISIGRY
ncbi:hypothetical protein Acaty_c1918 [Acidithiobacillus caldus ATCC 51756]|uniref:Uncharacterized protein n=1 Tax=Acidithiobacillus caldus (strain ATCC 51756 / DSM 8584 / KU) TaxID=637389 RepID=A0A060A0X9_ACICK|nr:hypothetical protein Acaty_c1918 [Acidithiobacillus caldus ATCC 51756]